MVISSARLAAAQLFAPHFRAALWKSVGLTVALLIGLWLGAQALLESFAVPALSGWPWVAAALVWLSGAGMIIGMAFLIGPVTALFAGLFLDDIAQAVEERDYPADRPGTALPVVRSVVLALKFLAVVIAANLVALLLVLLPGVNFAIFFLVNGYLLGREYFEFVALRLRSEDDARGLRSVHGARIMGAGLVIAAFMAVPILNLATPMFATAMMVHLHKAISGSKPVRR